MCVRWLATVRSARKSAAATSWFVRPSATRAATRRSAAVSPSSRVRALGGLEGVTVTGRVPDIRPYLAHANLVVAPLRLARGVQNKVLEAMAIQSGRSVVYEMPTRLRWRGLLKHFGQPRKERTARVNAAIWFPAPVYA